MVELRSSPEMMASLRPSATLFPHTRKARHALDSINLLKF